MLTDHVLDLAEAQLGAHDRSQRAAFEGFLSKPFDLEVPLNTVAGDVQNLSARPCPFQCSAPRSSTANTCRSEDRPSCPRTYGRAEVALLHRGGQLQPSVTWLALRCWGKRRQARLASTCQLRDAGRQFIQIEWLSKERRYTERFVPRG